LRRLEFIAGRCKDGETLLRIYSSLFKLYHGLGRFELAAIHAARFAELATEQGNDWLLADALEGQATALFKQSALRDALKAMERAAELRGSLGDGRGRIRCMRLQADIMAADGTSEGLRRSNMLQE